MVDECMSYSIMDRSDVIIALEKAKKNAASSYTEDIKHIST